MNDHNHIRPVTKSQKSLAQKRRIVGARTSWRAGHSFLQILEPIFDEFLAVVQNLEQRDERDFKYQKRVPKQGRYQSVRNMVKRVR
jgi:hypothetical protein